MSSVCGRALVGGLLPGISGQRCGRALVLYLLSVPHANKELLSVDPIHHGLIPIFLWLNGREVDSREVDSNDHGITRNLPLTGRNSEPNAILSDL